MKSFAIGLFILNLLYLAWNIELFLGSESEQQVVVRNASQQAPQSLVLLNELEELPPLRSQAFIEGGSEAAYQDTEDTQQIRPDEVALACMALGGFADEDSSNDLLQTLARQGFQTNMEIREEIDSKYRVYMPPFNSDAIARQTLASLLESGIDSFIINDGELALGISLGVFTQQSSAYRLQEELAAQGYASGIQEIISSNTEYWILVRSASAADLQALWHNLSVSGNDLIRSENLCEIVAPGG
jgi:hypothetical protein